MAKIKYGTTPWGAAFLDSIEQRTDDGRLSRGRSYANTGKVYNIALTSNTISAKVKGNYKPFYKTQLTFNEFPKGDKKFITDYIENNPLILAQIINSKLSLEVLDYLQKNEIDLFRDFSMHCSCPDFYGAYPCKHIAGLYYILVKEIDKNPFILFSLRGLNLIEDFHIKKNLEIPYPLPIEYQTASQEDDITAQEMQILQLEPQKEFILSMLEPNPPFASIDYKVVFEQFYTAIAKKLPLVVSMVHDEKITHIQRIFQSATILCTIPYNIKEARFEIQSELFKDVKNRELFELDKDNFKKNALSLTPTEMFTYFISFENEEGSKEYHYLYYLFRVAYICLQKSAFIPAVFQDAEDMHIFYKPLLSNEQLKQQTSNLSNISEPIALFEKKQLGATSQTIVMLASIFTDIIPHFNFMHKAQKNNPPAISYTFFQGQVQKFSKFEEQNIPLAIKNYFALFEINRSDYNYTLYIDKSTKLYELSLLVQEKSSKKQYQLQESLEWFDKIQIAQLVNYIALFLPKIVELLKNNTFELSKEELEDFLLQTSHILSNLGIKVILPKELNNLLRPKLTLKVTAKSKSHRSFFDLDGMLEYDWQIAIGNQLISADEFEQLVQSGKELVEFKENFVLLSPEELKAIFSKINRKKRLSTFEILQAKLNDEALFDGELESLFEQIFTPKEISIPATIQADLREYQKSGFAWNINNLENGFGTILADDMGLGKTLQAITSLVYLKEQERMKQALVVVPTSLLSNWEAEIKKFAPSLSYFSYYGNKRAMQKADVILSTYDIVRRDIESFKKQKIDCLIIDEAQKIKNPQTKVAKSIKTLKAKYRIALSGTPVENNLSELWSIFDFAIPKYLKSLKDFTNTFAKDIEIDKNPQKIQQLKAITAPFMLRRLKTDKSIIKDLPDKIIIDEYAMLSKEQASLYQVVVDETMQKLQSQENTKGAIFKLLVSLKQICNHPRNFDKTSPSERALSGKTELLLTLLEPILEKNEKVLIFTQYTQMAEILQEIIQKELLTTPLYLSGGMSKKRRDEAVDNFQRDPRHKIFILSLKAGGVGLNLTAANHVIHYDLWFNPAVENQATDRAFRIGQQKNVFVHRLITKNSFEEKIDQMIKAKKELSDLSISIGESWLSDMDRDELREIFAQK